LEADSSIFQSSLPIETKLERARMELLDLSARNRLLNVPRFSKSAKTIDIVDEKSSEIYRLLVYEQKAFTFLAGRPDQAKGDEATSDDDLPPVYLALPEDTEEDERGILRRHTDTKFQTRMTPSGLQKRLLDLYFDARTLEEEQGVNILFLALGTLKWIDPNNKENVRYAPLILVPVMLERGTAGDKFRLRARSEDQTANLSLEAYLDRVHQLKLPSFEDSEDFDPTTYFSAVADAVSMKPDWAVNADDIVLGFFSFAKFLMYRDLDPENWPQDTRITEQQTIRSLLSDGFENQDSLLPDDLSIDVHISPSEMLHIVDSDSSQTLAVHDVRQGRNLVIQGPPGTGKSQTIANVIASAVADGKTVLFVAEKMAALDVVKRRLDQAGVGDACLELHSNKTNKRALLEELRRTWELGSPRGEFPTSLTAKLLETRDVLNDHADRMHEAHSPSELTPYQVFGQLSRLRQQGQQPVELRLEEPASWSPDGLEMRRRLLSEVVQRIEDIGLPIRHPWNSVGLDVVLPTTIERLVPKIAELRTRTEALKTELLELARTLGIEQVPTTPSDSHAILMVADLASQAPDFEPSALSSNVWNTDSERIASTLEAGSAFSDLNSELDPFITESALTTSLESVGKLLARLPSSMSSEAFDAARELATLLPALKSEAERLRAELGSNASSGTLFDLERLTATGERVGSAPDASPEAFAATVWDSGVEQAGDLAEAVAVLEGARTNIGDRLSDVAWTTDVASTRQALATHTGVFKSLSGEYRRARALGRSLIKDQNIAGTAAVELLDQLMKGQAAARRIKEGDAFGRSAFGADWRGERSASAPLLALVEWMRTLRGLGAEPRLIAGRLAERGEVSARARRVRELLERVRPAASRLWDQLGTTAGASVDETASADRAALTRVEAFANALANVDALCSKVMRSVPAVLPERLELVHRIEAMQALALKVAEGDAIAHEAFGSQWKKTKSDWPTLAKGAAWITANGRLRRVVAVLPDRGAVVRQAHSAHTDAAGLSNPFDEISSTLKTDAMSLFGIAAFEQVPMDDAIRTFAGWLSNTEQLSKWVAYRERADKARSEGMSEFIDSLSDGRLATGAASRSFEIAYHEAMLDEMASKQPELARFDGTLHGRMVREFANLDRERIRAASLEVVRAHHRRIPSRDGGVGPVGILKGEMARRRGHMPIRSLFQKAGPAIQALKPVMMMSPLSVAQFLTPGRMNFDLLVMDEASQIQPVDALGAIARTKQVVVVGDERQLPPTKFFAKMTGSQEDDDETEGAQVTDIESILGLFTARGLPQRMLRWHYRSRHQSLIAVSNAQFYENRLFIVPSPYTQEAGMGLRFHHVPDGVFDSGGTSTNAVEARTVAEAILRHAKTYPGMSLGVATFSVSQRRAIQDEVEILRRLNPDTEEFFHAHPSEPFFIKNLENVQGDERDVIMISVGYAKNAQGYMAMRFGPLGAEGGERRLNVLISRAKRRCEVFASITDEDIDTERGKGKGIFAFKLFLHYARTGRLSAPKISGRELDSAFEEQVATALQDRGYQVHPQVGIAGFFIDLAIADPERPGRYLIGLECDGASYHSARSARDRDRLRQAVLEDHGWIIHRIWSADWFQRPKEQLELTISAIEAAKAELDERMELSHLRNKAVPVEIVTFDRGDVTEVGLFDVADDGLSGQTYVEATLSRSGMYELHETPIGVMAGLVAQVVSVESPIHRGEVVARLRDAWGLQRAGDRINTAVDAGIRFAVQDGRVRRLGEFLFLPDSEMVLRDRRDVSSMGLRKPEMIAPEELAAGVLRVVESNLGASDEEVVLTIARLLGFKSTSAQLRAAILGTISPLVDTGKLERRDGMLVVAKLEAMLD
jgi:very-short-patch-repair endonuclease